MILILKFVKIQLSVDEDAARGEFIRDALAIQMWRLLCNEFREIKILL